MLTRNQQEFDMHGLNIQEPFATLIAMGIKKTETRSYPPPANLINRRIALIATGKQKASVVGTARLRGWMEYDNERQFKRDYENHRVPIGSPFSWKDGKRKCGWLFSDPTLFHEHVPAPDTGGIVWYKDVQLATRLHLQSL